MVTAQTAPRRSLRVDAAGAAAALRREGRGRAMPVRDVLRLSDTKHGGGSEQNWSPASEEHGRLTTMVSSFSGVSRMMMRSISWFRPSTLLRKRGAEDLDIGMGIRMVLGIWV